MKDFGPFVALLGVSLTLLINGGREERGRRREAHARAIEAVVAYLQMPYRIHRRRNEIEHRSQERIRLSDDFSLVQAELASCEALVRADRSKKVRDAYAGLVETLKCHAGGAAKDAWKSEPVCRDQDMGLGSVHVALEPVRQQQAECEQVMGRSLRRFRMGWPWPRRD